MAPQDALSASDLEEASMTLGEFIQKFSHNNIIRLWYAERNGNRLVLKNHNDTSMDWQVLYQQGPYRHFINNKVIKLTTYTYPSRINVRHPEALNIVIEKLQNQPYLEEIPDEGFNVVRSEAVK